MDHSTTLAAAQADPLGFLQDLSDNAIIDEVQRAPQLFLSIKQLVDENRKDRSLILTGSADVMTLPQVADSLAGRIEIHNLWPLSQSEILGKKSKFLSTLIAAEGRFQSERRGGMTSYLLPVLAAILKPWNEKVKDEEPSGLSPGYHFGFAKRY